MEEYYKLPTYPEDLEERVRGLGDPAVIKAGPISYNFHSSPLDKSRRRKYNKRV